MDTNKGTARIAGVSLLLALLLTCILSLGYAPGRLLIEGDAATTIARITDEEWMFRLAIVVGVIACAVLGPSE